MARIQKKNNINWTKMATLYVTTHADTLFIDYIVSMHILLFVNKNPYIKNDMCCELFVIRCALTIYMNFTNYYM